MLRKGNHRPSPGPDGWEKWCVKNLSDDALTLVLDLHNYIVQNSFFPGNVKDMTSTVIHKRNLRTDLLNYRGIMLSNFLANSLMTWLTNQLTEYASRKAIIPDTQVATQKGVQTRDVISYLSSVKCYAQRNKQTVYALQRDQMKGFDYLAPQGFYDALRAYGLPDSVADLDRAAQSNTKVFIRTAYGIAGPIITNAVTKQGGPASPIKSTLTTSLGHRYLEDMARNDPGVLVIQTESSREGRAPHTPEHSTQMQITMAEATDDSLIFATTIGSLQKFTLEMERFQYAYGWLTSWKKTTAFGLCVPENMITETIRMPSITVKDDKYIPNEVTWHDVTFKIGELHFLRARIDDSASRFQELRDFISNFNFPKFSIQTPITLARKIVMQNIASRCRALLSIQPIKQADAQALDRQICSKVHEMLRFPYNPNPNILTLPLENHGLDFPSIERINAGIAVEGIMRDLNHHIPAYRAVARVTMADWTCRYNKCKNPIDQEGLRRDFGHYYGRIPMTWLIAHKIMGSIVPPLNLRLTDANYIINGDVSIQHAMNIAKENDLQGLNGASLLTITRNNLQMLKDIGKWKIDEKGRYRFKINNSIKERTGKWTMAARRNWECLSETMSHLQTEWFYEGSSDLLLTRGKRQEISEAMVKSLGKIMGLEATKQDHEGRYWASDGLMKPAASGILDPKSVTTAITGPQTIVMQIPGRNTSILHGEIMGLIAGHILTMECEIDKPQELFSDHLNTVRFIQDARSRISQEAQLRYRNGRSYLRWLQNLVQRSTLRVQYTKGHSDQVSIQAKLNDEADYYATDGQKYINKLPVAPIPTFYMNDYTFYRDQDGWIESNIRNFVEKTMALKTSNNLAIGNRHRMKSWLYHRSTPPTYVYHKATSAYTATVQLYARSGQLPTAENMRRKGVLQRDEEVLCRLGCDEIETLEHVFVECREFDEWRKEAGMSLEGKIREKLKTWDIGEERITNILSKAKFFFQNRKELWPLGDSQYYLGHVPKIEPLMPIRKEETRLERERIIYGIYCEWHNASIRLASRIFGEIQRKAARHWDERGGEKKREISERGRN